MENRIKTVIGAVLNIDAFTLAEQSLNPDKLDQWDSLSHLILISCLEEEFDIKIPIDDIPKLKDFHHILNWIRKTNQA